MSDRNWVRRGKLAVVKDDKGRWAISRQSIDKFKKDTRDGIMSQYRCCDELEWEPVSDLGHTAGADFDLGRCKNCGAYLMAVFYVVSTTYNILSKEEAEEFLQLQKSPKLNAALRRWFDS